MSAYIVKVTMEHTHPPVWRRIVLPEKITYEDLHKVLQIAFGWTNEHLHDFSFPNTDYRVVMDEEDMDFGDCVLEKETLIDEDLKDYNWIRYTYDFGDDWQHKIQFEKEDPSYKERYAKIIKWKGDNFQEDIGGVFGAYLMENGEREDEYAYDDFQMEPRLPFDSEEANRRLEKVTFPVGKKKKRRKRSGEEDPFSYGAGRTDIEQLVKQLLRKMASEAMESVQFEERPKPSAIDKMADSWRTFCEHWVEALKAKGVESLDQKTGPKTPKEFIDSMPKEPVYEQLVLPGVDLTKGEEQPANEIKAGKCVIRFVPDDHTMEQNLNRHAEQHLRNYCKYLRIAYQTGTKTDVVKAFCAEIRKHPEYLRLALTYDQLECLLSLAGLRDARYRVMSTDAVELAIFLGLMRCNVRNSSRQKKAELSFAADAAELLKRAADTDLDAYYKDLDERDHSTLALLEAYGVLEVSKLFELSREFAGCTLCKKAFERYVYWHLRLPNTVVTFSDHRSKAYAALPELDAERIMRARESCAKKLPYREMTRELYKKWLDGFMAVCEEWQFLAEEILGFIADSDAQRENAFELLLRCYRMVQNGCNIRDLCGEICKTAQPKGISDYVFLWESAMGVIMKTGLPALKGYSREAYMQTVQNPEGPELGAILQYLPEFPPDDLTREFNQDTHLYEFDESAAELMMDALSIAERSGKSDSLAEAAETLGHNKELLFVQAVIEMRSQRLAKADAILSKLISCHNGYTDDLEALRDSMGFKRKGASSRGKKSKSGVENAADKVTPIPVRKAEAKIYPNDPCPCGSGKKYKHCCGRKR